MPDKIALRYDEAIFDAHERSLYGESGFYNVGDWSDGPLGRPASLAEAARRLVERHLRADNHDEAQQASVVLDVGCGLGAGAAMMALHYPQALVLGVNISLKQASHAMCATPHARFAVMDATRLAIASGSVDRVHCVEAAFHFDSRDEFLAEAHRVLRPGGKMILTDIMFKKDYGNSIPPRNIWSGEAEYRRRCEIAGLKILEFADITKCTLAPFYEHLAANGRRAESILLARAHDRYVFATVQKM